MCLLYERRHDARGVAQRQLQPCRRRSFPVPGRVTGQLHIVVSGWRNLGGNHGAEATYPSERQSDNHIQTAGNEEAAKVMDAGAGVGEEHAVADDADGAEDDAEETAALELVG